MALLWGPWQRYGPEARPGKLPHPGSWADCPGNGFVHIRPGSPGDCPSAPHPNAAQRLCHSPSKGVPEVREGGTVPCGLLQEGWLHSGPPCFPSACSFPSSLCPGIGQSPHPPLSWRMWGVPGTPSSACCQLPGPPMTSGAPAPFPDSPLGRRRRRDSSLGWTQGRALAHQVRPPAGCGTAPSPQGPRALVHRSSWALCGQPCQGPPAFLSAGHGAWCPPARQESLLWPLLPAAQLSWLPSWRFSLRTMLRVEGSPRRDQCSP